MAHPIVNIYEAVKAKLEADLALDLKNVDWWDNNINRMEAGDYTSALPAVFIEFPNNTVYSDGSYHNQYSDNFLLTLHIVTLRADQDFPTSLNFAQDVFLSLDGFNGTFGNPTDNEGGFNDLRRREERRFRDTKQHYDIQMDFMTNLSDGSASRDKKLVEITLGDSGLKVEKDID